MQLSWWSGFVSVRVPKSAARAARISGLRSAWRRCSPRRADVFGTRVVAHCRRPELDQQLRDPDRHILTLAGLAGQCDGVATVRANTESLWKGHGPGCS